MINSEYNTSNIRDLNCFVCDKPLGCGDEDIVCIKCYKCIKTSLWQAKKALEEIIGFLLEAIKPWDIGHEGAYAIAENALKAIDFYECHSAQDNNAFFDMWTELKNEKEHNYAIRHLLMEFVDHETCHDCTPGHLEDLLKRADECLFGKDNVVNYF